MEIRGRLRIYSRDKERKLAIRRSKTKYVLNKHSYYDS